MASRISSRRYSTSRCWGYIDHRCVRLLRVCFHSLGLFALAVAQLQHEPEVWSHETKCLKWRHKKLPKKDSKGRGPGNRNQSDSLPLSLPPSRSRSRSRFLSLSLSICFSLSLSLSLSLSRSLALQKVRLLASSPVRWTDATHGCWKLSKEGNKDLPNVGFVKGSSLRLEKRDKGKPSLHTTRSKCYMPRQIQTQSGGDPPRTQLEVRDHSNA